MPNAHVFFIDPNLQINFDYFKRESKAVTVTDPFD